MLRSEMLCDIKLLLLLLLEEGAETASLEAVVMPMLIVFVIVGVLSWFGPAIKTVVTPMLVVLVIVDVLSWFRPAITTVVLGEIEMRGMPEAETTWLLGVATGVRVKLLNSVLETPFTVI